MSGILVRVVRRERYMHAEVVIIQHMVIFRNVSSFHESFFLICIFFSCVDDDLEDMIFCVIINQVICSTIPKNRKCFVFLFFEKPMVSNISSLTSFLFFYNLFVTFEAAITLSILSNTLCRGCFSAL